MANTLDDHLILAQNSCCQKMLTRIGKNFPLPEKVLFSGAVIKINKRGKEQKRVLLVTDKALYNLKPREYSKCQRRIAIEKIVSISEAKDSDEFAVHVPEEYDYRYKTNDKYRIIEIVSAQSHELSKYKENLKVSSMTALALAGKILTKDEAKLQTREQRYERYLQLVSKENFEEEVEDAKRNSRKTVEMQGFDNVDHEQKKIEVTADSFEFVRVLGRGAFGKVMLVKKKGSGQVFAMKILKKKYLLEKHQVDNTNAERRILMSLQHPFLMQLRFAFQTEAKLYFVLDFYQGGELFFHLKKLQRFSEEQAKFFVAEVGCALGHLHSLDIVYRDLKPENVLLDSTGHVCLTDFGLCKELGGDETANTFCGTPEYLAPEIIAKTGHGKPVDWWALGILLYELTVGFPPFYDRSVRNMLIKIQTAPLLLPSLLSESCRDLIIHLLHRTPGKRLGAGENDFKEIQAHKLWHDLDWDKLLTKQIDPPYKPNCKGEDTGTLNFDSTFLLEKPQDSYAAPPILAKGKTDGFESFSYAQNTE